MTKNLVAVFAFVAAVAILLRVAASVAFPDLAVSSWFRDPWHNARVQRRKGRKPKFSYHLLGWALDFATISAKDVARIKRFFAVVPFAQVVAESNHVHVEIDPRAWLRTAVA